jgi:hypothetical protein
LVFKNDIVEGGKAIFQSDEASCFLCHQNGGAHFGNNGRPHGNLERNQGIELFSQTIISANTGIVMPVDPGNGNENPTSAALRGMNVQSIIEAARRTHFAHNNAIGEANGGDFESMVGEGFHKPFVRDMSPEGCAGTGVVGTGAPGREGLAQGRANLHADSVECLDLAVGANGVERMATFLRALSAWYSLRDIERWVDETCTRIDYGISTALPILEAGFAIDDVAFALSGSKVDPIPHKNIADDMPGLKADLIAAAGSQDKRELHAIHVQVGKMRKKIAKTSQEADRHGVCK